MFFQCSPTQEASTFVEIPELLERSQKIQYPAEWAEVRNRYAELKHQISKDEKNINASLALVQLFISEARVTGEHAHYYGASRKIIHSILKKGTVTNDQKFLALSYKASVELSLHEFNSAYLTALEALKLNHTNAQVYGALVDACVELGNYNEAVKWADQMNALKPDIRSYSRVAYLREIFGLPEDAIDALKLAVLAGSPGSEEKSWAALQLAKLLIKYGSKEEGEDILRQILEERENYPFAWGALADYKIEQGFFSEAEKILKDACKIIPEFGFYVSLAHIYKKQDRISELNSVLKEIELMISDDINHGHNMSLEWAEIQLELFQDPEKALQIIQKDYEMRPNNIQVNALMASIYIALKNRLKAEEHFAKAVSTGSLDPQFTQIQSQIQKIQE